uniref:Enhancer of rudimentary homolog n=1 Tax=Anopheles dirus TaxID=7168 RepID=A0A182NL60_9DIPT
MSHVILLVQIGSHLETRSFSDYGSLHDCLNHVCIVFEKMLRARYPHKSYITYDLEQLFRYIDEYHEICCLVYENSTGTYKPYSRVWIKDQIYHMLEKVAFGSAPNGQK